VLASIPDADRRAFYAPEVLRLEGELRAATSLARLLRSTGRPDEARRALEGVYGSFIEGFETADLRTARALMAELA
jgi:predicted ATPase